MLVFSQIVNLKPPPNPNFTLALTAEQRTRSRHVWQIEAQQILFRLPRGTKLNHGSLLQAESGEILAIEAKPEPVITAIAPDDLTQLKATYHLGNRHVPLEINSNYLRLAADPVLEKMLQGLGLQTKLETLPFQPEPGAYHH